MIRIGTMTFAGVALPFCASLLLGAAGGCAEGNRGTRQFAGHLDEIEISPGRFLTVQRRDKNPDNPPATLREVVRSARGSAFRGGDEEWTSLLIPWQDTNLVWNSGDIPITLRERQGRLYLIGFDRVTDLRRPCFRYYVQDGVSFREIKPGEFPREIATQNMWLDGPGRFFMGATNGPYDHVALARDLDVENPFFSKTLTAHIWCHLMTGRPYHENWAKSCSVEKDILQEYVRMYAPIKLTAILRTDTNRPAWMKEGMEASR